MIIDAHVHGYPEEVARDPAAWARARGEAHWAGVVAPRPDGFSLQGWAGARQMLAEMDAAGVERAVLLGWYWERQETCEEQNRWHAAWVKEAPDRFWAFAAVQPAAGERALESLRRAVEEEGFCGVGEMLPAAQGFAPDDPCWERLLGWAQESGLPVNLHLTEPVGRRYPGRVETPLGEVQRLAENFPDLRLILAHWGGGMPFYELNPAGQAALRNVVYDTAASPLIYRPEVFRTVVDLAGADKVLFGSDYPLKLYPRGRPEHPSMAPFLDEVRGSGLTADELEQVLGGNARRIIGGGRS